MNVYVDISYLYFVLQLILINLEVYNLLGLIKKNIFVKSIVLSLSFVSYYFNQKYIILLILFILNIVISKQKKVLFSTLFLIFYLLSSLMVLLFPNNFIYHNYFVLLLKINSIFLLSFQFILIKLIALILSKIINRIKLKKYVYDIELEIDKTKIFVKGFYDTGNNFQVHKYPVIFLKSKKNIKLGGVSSFDSFYKKSFKKAKIKIKSNKDILIKDVLILEVSDKEDFFGCDCLLNTCIF